MLTLVPLASRFPSLRESNVQQTGLSVGVVAIGFPDIGNDALSLHLFPVWQGDQAEEPIRNTIGLWDNRPAAS
jgi:hypothetical protein